MSSLTLDGAGRWAEVPQLPPEVERAAARALVDFLREVEKAVLEAKAAGPEVLEELHRVWDFTCKSNERERACFLERVANG